MHLVVHVAQVLAECNSAGVGDHRKLLEFDGRYDHVGRNHQWRQVIFLTARDAPQRVLAAERYPESRACSDTDWQSGQIVSTTRGS